MKRKKLWCCVWLCACFFLPLSVNALSYEEIESRNECGDEMFEVALAEANGTATKLACYSDYNAAYQAMNSGSDNAILFQRTGGVTYLVNAKYALLDLSVTNQESGLTYYYPDDGTTTSKNNYMNNKATYGGTDGALISVTWTNDPENHRMAHLKVAGYDGYINYHTNFTGYQTTDYQIVPLAWVQSSSYYEVSSDGNRITHCYTANVNGTTSAGCRTIGPKPSQLTDGIYYSYDGKYFYRDRKSMLQDYKEETSSRAVNSTDPYYNYYLYLPSHAKSTYSGTQIDQYIRDVTGQTMLAYGAASTVPWNASMLYGKGLFFTNAQEQYGANALIMYGISRNETGNGKSSMVMWKRNGFGMNAYDSDTSQSTFFARYEESVYAFASVFITYGYSDPNDSRYYGSNLGHKGIGMNIKYASDPFWSEKAAAVYNAFDASGGYQDYDYYQLGVTTTGGVNVRSGPGTQYRSLYQYRVADIPVIIIGEEKDANGQVWYQVVSDMNLDANKNEITCSDRYNCPNFEWTSSYVYVSSQYIKKINTGKNGYQAPTETYQYQDTSYTYEFYTESSSTPREDPIVGKITKDTDYYYDSSLQTKKDASVVAGRYVMVYAVAKDASGNIVSYLVTSDYNYDQEDWVPASKIQLVGGNYGRDIVDPAGYYTDVRASASESSAKVGRLYDDTYIPILNQTTDASGRVWYQTQTSLTGDNVLGWVLADDGDTRVIFYQGTSLANEAPIITAEDLTLVEKSQYNLLDGVKASDPEDGDLTSQIQVTTNLVIDQVGTYEATYTVTDTQGTMTVKTVKIYVIADQEPVITVQDQKVTINSSFDPQAVVTATDEEDGIITNIQVIYNDVKLDQLGCYSVTYQVMDSYGHTVTKTIQVEVIEKQIQEVEGLFYFDSLTEVDGELQLKGYQTINGIDNTLTEEITYTVIFQNLETGEETTQQATRITDQSEMPRPIYGVDQHDYTYAWFKLKIDLTALEEGDYKMTILAVGEDYQSRSIVSNKLYKTQLTGFSGDKEVITRNNFNDKTGPVELVIRKQSLANKTASYIYNQYDTYRTFEFTEDNKLHLRGVSYSYGADLSENQQVTREIIFENKNDYSKVYRYSLGSNTDELYTVTLPVDDALGKKRAWYEQTLDISNIPVGEYVIYITTTSNITDIAEFTEKLNRSLANVQATIDGKKYTFEINYQKGSRIEMKVENAN